MPPKRKAAATKGRGGKKAKKTTGDDVKSKMAALKTADAESEQKQKKTPEVCMLCPVSRKSIVEDYNCLLSKTNTSQSNKQYYLIQLIEGYSEFFLWTRWGRMGELGDDELEPFSYDPIAAKKAFCKKFADKTKNKWENRANFVPAAGKYTLIEVEDLDKDEVPGICRDSE